MAALLALPSISLAQFEDDSSGYASICRKGLGVSSVTCQPGLSPSITVPLPDNATSVGRGSNVTVKDGASFGVLSVANRDFVAVSTTVFLGDDDPTVAATASRTKAAFSVGSNVTSKYLSGSKIGQDIPNSIFNRQIINVAASTEDTDAVNVSQLKYVYGLIQENGAWNLTTNGDATTSATVNPGDTVDFSPVGTNIEIDNTDKAVSIGLARNLNKIQSIQLFNATDVDTIKIDGDAGHITGLTNKILTVTGFATLGRAATEEQLKVVNDTANMGWNISANGGTSAKVAPGGLVDFKNTDNNIVIMQTGTNMTFNLSPDLKIAKSITTNNFFAKGETKLGDNFWVTKEGDVHYDGPIDQSTHIVNKEYVDNSIGDIGEIANKGWNLSTNGGPVEKVAPGATVDLANTDGNIVITQTGTKVVHNLSDNLKVAKSITIGGGTMVVNEGSVTIKEGTTVDMGVTVLPM